MIGILGKKIGMTQLFAGEGNFVPVTVIQAGPCRVVQKKETGKEGYESIQIGFQPAKDSKVTKAVAGHCKKASPTPFRHLREIRVQKSGAYELGQELKVDMFKPGDLVDVIGTSIGKGFAGVIKRHGFRGGAGSHGSMFHRAPGSIGSSSYPSRVFKGMRMAGHLGNVRKTAKNLTVLRVDTANNLLLVKGAVPGSHGGLVVVVARRSSAE